MSKPQGRDLLNAFDQNLKSAFSSEICLHPSAPTGCGHSIRAHTIQRSGGLTRIAQDGNVLQFRPNLWELEKTNGKILPKTLGVRVASTFMCFCDQHDGPLFDPIETQSLKVGDEALRQQVFLFHYRALAREIYVKSASIANAKASLPLIQPDNDDLSPEMVASTAGMIQAYWTYLDLRNLLQQKRMLAKQFATQDWTCLSYILFRIAGQPRVAASGFLAPGCDADGKPIQELAKTGPLQWMSFTLQPDDEGAFCLISWLKHQSNAPKKLVNSLMARPRKQLPFLLTEYVFRNLENLFIDPTWYDGIDDGVRNWLHDLVVDNTPLMTEPDGAAKLGIKLNALGDRVRTFRG